MDWAFSDIVPTKNASQEIESAGECRLCGISTIQKCERCGDHYCSEKCYKHDWPNHRYICFPRPSLLRVTGIPMIDDIKYPAKTNVISTKNSNEDIKELRDMMKHYNKDMKSLRDMMELMMEKIDRIEDVQSKKNDKTDMMQLMMEKIDRIEDFQSKNTNSSNKEIRKVNLCNGIKDVDSSCNDLSELATTKRSEPRKSDPRSNRIKVDDNDNVVLCAFRSTNRCAIRSKNPEIEMSYYKVIAEIDKYGRDAPALSSIPKLGSYAIAMKTNKQFTRVKVVKVFSEDRIRVMLCDYGNSVCRKLCDLREISKDIMELPEFVSTIQLHGVNMSQYSTKIIDFFKSYERKVYKIKFIKENGNTLAQLYDAESNVSLNETLANFVPENDVSSTEANNPSKVLEESNTTLNDSAQKSKILEMNSESENEYENEAVMTPPFETITFKLHLTNIKAVVLDTSLIECGYVSCTERNSLAYLSQVQNILANMEFDDDLYEPKLNEYCVALFENEWYRGKVAKIVDGTKYEISFIDFLNISTLTSAEIRPYPRELTINCYTTLCQIDGLPKKITKKQREFLKKTVKLNDIITIDRVLEIEDGNIALVECSEIILSMHAENVM